MRPLEDRELCSLEVGGNGYADRGYGLEAGDFASNL
jgi:hypothetical protein